MLRYIVTITLFLTQYQNINTQKATYSDQHGRQFRKERLKMTALTHTHTIAGIH